MEAYNTTIYPVFEADQVLSQNDLNTIVSHLEEQDRITRKNLTGLGIVCGLDLTFPTSTSAKIDCGTAVTSLGFQINWKETTFENYREYELSENFLQPDYLKEPHLDPIFKHVTQYVPIKNCIELLPATSTVEGKLPIPDNFFEDKAIILLLEVALIDQKNCVTTNCDDKGKRMEFNVRPLLIPIEDATQLLLPEYPSVVNYDEISLPRYNVPYKKIVSGAEVLKGFEKIYDTSLLNSIATSINTVYQDFITILPTNPNFVVLQNAKDKMDEVVNFYKTSNSVQYLWDWIFDIGQAYNEIVEFKKINPSFCCVNEALFPFHVVLGTNSANSNNYRTLFYNALNTSTNEKNKLKKITLLFERLAQIINTYKYDSSAKIKITPSVYGNVPLSEKSIPFYYDDVLNLNKKWNPELAEKNQTDTILSYHSEIANYSSKLSVQKPLLFDLESYNFFRVEGHIGKNYKTALKEINLIKDSYALPFKITALNAVDFVNKQVDILKFDGRWDDLETDYDLARKRIYNITEFVINWMDLRKSSLTGLMTEDSIASFKSILSQMKNLLTNDLKEFLPNFTSFYEIFKQLNYVFLFHRWCIQLNQATLSTIAEDLIDRLDDINELFLEDPFTVIYEEANLRWQKIYKDLFFSTFMKKHPGLEHKAGVTKGGTLVLVYVDTTIFKAPAAPVSHTALLNSIKAYKNNFSNIAISDKQNIERSVKFKDYKSQISKPNTSSIDKCKAEADNIKTNLLEVAQHNLNANYSVEMSGFLLENIKEVLQYDTNTSVDQNPYQQVIIADFFLPYACCGDGTTVEVKIETIEPVTISLDQDKYCKDDTDGVHEITLKGKFGGAFSGDASSAVETTGDKYYLNPNHASLQIPKTYSLTYAVDGETSNTVEFQILEPTSLNWSAVRNENDHNEFTFINANDNDTHEYEFDFGAATGTETMTTTQKTVTQLFEFNESVFQFTVTITQLGEVCRNSQTITVENPIGDFGDKDFNIKDFNT